MVNIIYPHHFFDVVCDGCSLVSVFFDPILLICFEPNLIPAGILITGTAHVFMALIVFSPFNFD